ncbi:MAG: hypothetical protein WBN39_02210, partial [Flavobacteriaceae bacterium]
WRQFPWNFVLIQKFDYILLGIVAHITQIATSKTHGDDTLRVTDHRTIAIKCVSGTTGSSCGFMPKSMNSDKPCK